MFICVYVYIYKRYNYIWFVNIYLEILYLFSLNMSI